MALVREGGVLKAPPPPRDAARLVKVASDAGAFKPVPPRGWIDEDEAIGLMQVSRTKLTQLISDGYFEASGYGTGNNNHRCLRAEAVKLFAKVFPNGSMPDGEHARMRALSALQFGRNQTVREVEWTASEAMDYADETLAVAQWVYAKGENRRPKGQFDKDLGIYRWPNELQREAYRKEQATKRYEAELQAQKRAAAELERVTLEEEQRTVAVTNAIAGVMSLVHANPTLDDVTIDNVVNTYPADIRSRVQDGVIDALIELRRDRTDDEIDAMLFKYEPKGMRTEFVLYAMREKARKQWSAHQPVNISQCEQYASVRLQCANWIKKFALQDPNTAQVISDFVYPTDMQVRAYSVWRMIKLRIHGKANTSAADIREMINETNVDRIESGFQPITEDEIQMVFKALTADGWSDTIAIEEAKHVDDASPTYYIDRAMAMERFGITGQLLDMLQVMGGIRVSTIELVGDGSKHAYNEIDLAILKYLAPTIAEDASVEEISTYIADLRPLVTYDDQVFKIDGVVPAVAKAEIVKGETDVFLSLAEISVLLKMHVSTVGALSNLGIARSKDGLISLLDVTVFGATYEPSNHEGNPFTFLRDNAAHIKEVIEGNRDLFVYSPARRRYERTTKMTTKKTEKTPPKKAAKAKTTTPAKAKKAVVTKARELAKPAVKISKEKEKAIEAAVKTVKAKKEMPREEAQEASAAAESLSKLPVVMIDHKTAYKTYGMAAPRIRTLIKQGILRGDNLIVSDEDVKNVTRLYPTGVLTDTDAHIKILTKQIKDMRTQGISKNVEKAVAQMTNAAAQVMERVSDDDATFVMVARPFVTLDDVRHYFSGAVVERYGTEPENWPDVMRSLGLSLGVIKKGG